MADIDEAAPSVSADGNQEEIRRQRGWQVSGLYSSVLTLLGIAWLIRETNIDSLSQNWLLFLFLIAVRIALSQLDVSSLLLDGSRYFRGVPGRTISWSAIIIIGPAGLWLDFVAAAVDALVHGRRQFKQIGGSVFSPWKIVRCFSLFPVRDAVPAIVAILLVDFLPVSSGEQQSSVVISDLLLK